MVTMQEIRRSALTIATTNARIVHAVTSSVAAHAIAVAPKGVLVSPRSSNIRARTGKAVMLMEMPMNKANARKVVFGAARFVNRNSEATTPKRK
jgi:hypothetical protein